MIQFYLNNLTNLHQLTSHSTTSYPTTWRSYGDHRLLWRHFNLSLGWINQFIPYEKVQLKGFLYCHTL